MNFKNESVKKMDSFCSLLSWAHWGKKLILRSFSIIYKTNIYTWNKSASNNILLNNKWFGTLERCVFQAFSLSSSTIFQLILHKIPIYKTSESWASLVRESGRKPKEPSAAGVLSFLKGFLGVYGIWDHN